MQIHNSPIFESSSKVSGGSSNLCPLSFGALPVKILNYGKIVGVVDRKCDGLYSSFLGRVADKSLLRVMSDGTAELREVSVVKKLWDTVSYPILRLPLDICVFVVGKLGRCLPNNKTIYDLYNSGFIKRYRDGVEREKCRRAVGGVLRHLDGICEKEKGGSDLERVISSEVDRVIGGAFSRNFGNYNTRDERGVNRFITAFIPAFFLGNDFYNRSIRNGASKAEARESARGKRNQELKMTAIESYTTFVSMGTFERLANNSKWGAPVIGGVASVGGNVLSRVLGKDKRSLTPIKIEELPERRTKAKCPSPAEIVDTLTHGKNPNLLFFTNGGGAVGCGVAGGVVNGGAEGGVLVAKGSAAWANGGSLGMKGSGVTGGVVKGGASATKSDSSRLKSDCSGVNKKQKGHLLSFKSLALFCATSIIGGYSLRYGKKFAIEFAKANPENGLVKFCESTRGSFKSYFDKLTMEELKIGKSEVDKFADILEGIGQKEAAATYKLELKEILKQRIKNNIPIEQIEKTVKIPLIGERVAIKDLLKIPVLPFKLIYELASYPYKAVAKIFNTHYKTAAKVDDAILNIYKDYKHHRSRFKSEKEFLEFYKKHFEAKMLKAFDCEGASKIDNTQIGRMTQLLTMVASLYFGAIDDYNQTGKETRSKAKAARAARERLIQKSIRIIVQLGLIDIFNSVFKMQYNSSLVGVLLVAGSNTVATDIVTRKLSGDSIFRRSKEGQEELANKRESGISGNYYKTIKKLAD